MHFPPASCHFLLPRSKYSLQHPVLKYLQYMLFPLCERPSFTPHAKRGKVMCFLYVNLQVFIKEIGKQEILNRMVTYIHHI